jgi:hypothetical protein
MQIWKQVLETTGRQKIKVPHGAKFLSVQVQHGVAVLWYLCSTANPKTEIVVDMRGTGHEINENPGKFAGTVQFCDGDLVMHVFFPFEEEYANLN